MKKKYAVIQVWRRGGGFGAGASPSFSNETFEIVKWFRTLHDVNLAFRNEPQGQTKTDGECNRIIVKIIERLK